MKTVRRELVTSFQFLVPILVFSYTLKCKKTYHFGFFLAQSDFFSYLCAVNPRRGSAYSSDGFADILKRRLLRSVLTNRNLANFELIFRT